MKFYRSLFSIVFLLLSASLCYAQNTSVGFYKGEAADLQSFALQSGKPYVVELNATWCGFCKLFERETLKDAGVIQYINEHYLMATMDGEEGYGETLYGQYKVKGFPTLLFFTSEGKLMGKMVGYQDSEEFLYNLQKFKVKFDKKYKAKK